MISKTYQLTEEEFRTIIKTSSSCADAMRKIGYTCTTGNANRTVKRRIEELNIDIQHWADNTKNAHIKNRMSNDKYYAKDTPHSGGHIRERLLQDNLLDYKCACCGNNGEWNGQKLVLQVDHINGDHNDNRIENLRFLCPNCHSQTKTFAGRNLKPKEKIVPEKTKTCSECGILISDNNESGLCKTCADKKRRTTERPSKEQLAQEIITSSFLAVGRKYGVSDNAIRKWCKAYGLPTKKDELKTLYKTQE